jgi:hypothetical protein
MTRALCYIESNARNTAMTAITQGNSTNGTSQAAIFARLWQTERGTLPRILARQVLKLGFSTKDKARMHELAVKNQEGRISHEELEELDNFVTAGDLLALLQSKARRALKQEKAGPSQHG